MPPGQAFPFLSFVRHTTSTLTRSVSRRLTAACEMSFHVQYFRCFLLLQYRDVVAVLVPVGPAAEDWGATQTFVEVIL